VSGSEHSETSHSLPAEEHENECGFVSIQPGNVSVSTTPHRVQQGFSLSGVSGPAGEKKRKTPFVFDAKGFIPVRE